MTERGSGGSELPEQGRNRFKALIIIVGAMVTLLLLGIAFAVAQFTLRSTTDTAVVVEGPLSDVAVEVDRGRVELTASRSEGAALDARVHYFVREPTLRDTRGEAGLELTADCDWPSDCEIDVEGAVQQDADIRIRTSSGGAVVQGAPGAVSVRSTDGGVTVRDARGDVNAGSSTGAIVVEGAQQAVRAESSSGRITVRDQTGPLRVRTATGFVVGERLASAESQIEIGSGRVDLQYVRPPERLEVDMSEGILELRIPAGRYRIDIEQSLGEQTIEGVERDSDAQRRLILRVNEGNVIVRGT